MTTITLKTTEKEKEILKEFAKFNGMSLNQFIKTGIFKVIEDEYDYKIGEAAYKDYLASGEVAKPFEELLEEYDVE